MLHAVRKTFAAPGAARFRLVWSLAVASIVLFATAACSEPGTAPTPAASGAEVLAEVQDTLWQRAMERSAFLRLLEGLEVTKLPRLDYETAVADSEISKAALLRLEQIEEESLEHADWVDLQALLWALRSELEGLEFFWHESVLTPYSSPLTELSRIFASRAFRESSDVSIYLDLLEQTADLVGELEARVRGQAERGIFVAQPALPASIALVRSFIAEPETGPFRVAEERLTALEQEDRARLTEGIGEITLGRINPALESLAAYLAGEYGEAAPSHVGAVHYPDGDAYYRYAARRATTLDTTPEEIHEIGKRLVAEMEAEMDAVRKEVSFVGTREQFNEYLKTDPQFFPESAEEIEEHLVRAAERMERRIDDFFLARPNAPYGFKRLDPALEGSQTYGFYEPPNGQVEKGFYNYNAAKLDERSWLGLAAISLHEAVPGHHFQIAGQNENESLSKLRRNTWYVAYTEGWGSYSTHLGLEAGVYDDDPYSRYGMYTLEVFLATRLVVDPGMNLLGWSLEEGREYMREHAMQSETQVQSESLRYSTDMPAQALGYQMGKLKLLELRKKAERELGAEFDIRRFHQAVLEHGALPLEVLESHIEWWIAKEKSRDRDF